MIKLFFCFFYLLFVICCSEAEAKGRVNAFSKEDTVNVLNYGAIGDGRHDETVAFKKAIKYAMDNRKPVVYIPTGIYLIGSKDDKTNISIGLQGPFNAKDSISVKFIGDQNKSIILTNLQDNRPNSSSTRIFSFTGFWYDLEFRNLIFKSTHPVTIGQTGAIAIVGVPGILNKRFKVSGCEFQGFSTAIGLNGVDGAVIEYCSFKAPRGHDDAQQTSSPAAFIWLIGNKNGAVSDIKILHCTGDGFTGSNLSSTATKSPMDNFLLGNPDGCDVEYNKLQNFGEELIGISGDNDYKRVCLVANNTLDCNIPVGAKTFYNNFSSKTSNYGIRVEAVNAVIRNNILTNVTTGIMQYADNEQAYSRVLFNDWTISNNIIRISNRQDVTPYGAISIVQNLKYTKKDLNVSITGNKIYVKTLPGNPKFAIFKILNFEKCKFSDNQVFNNEQNVDITKSNPAIFQLKNIKKLSVNGKAMVVN